MKLLVLGGTVFLGRAIVEAALAAGHTVTLFNRGQHNPELFPDLEKLRGDREHDLSALAGRRWDAVIDPSGFLPGVVRASAEVLAGAAEHYTLISSISVFSDFSQVGMDENGPLATLEPGEEATFAMERYGALKAACEQALRAAWPGGCLIVRPGLIVGPHDASDRFTYWPRRVAAGGEVLAPGRPGRPVQLIDVRDLAGWIVRMVAAGGTGTYNATGPAAPLPMEQLLAATREATGGDARFTWVPDAFLEAQGVGAWMELPLWVPETDPTMAGFSQVDCGRARAAGLTFRPLADTVRDTLAWDRTRDPAGPRRAGLDPAREQEVLAAWHAAQAAPAGEATAEPSPA